MIVGLELRRYGTIINVPITVYKNKCSEIFQSVDVVAEKKKKKQTKMGDDVIEMRSVVPQAVELSLVFCHVGTAKIVRPGYCHESSVR